MILCPQSNGPANVPNSNAGMTFVVELIAKADTLLVVL